MEELERFVSALDGSASSELVAKAKAAAAAVRQELELHKQTAATRQKSGQDWQTLAGEREAEAVRLRAEINRMRQALNSSTESHANQAKEVAAMQAQLQEALAINRAQQRQTVVTTAACEGPNAELYRLRAELDGRTAQLAEAEAQLKTQAAAAANRMNEMQESFLAKIADIRRNNQLQLEQAVAAARATAASESSGKTGPRAGAAAMEQQNAQRLQKAEAEATNLRHQLEAAQAAAQALQAKLDQTKADADASRSQLTSTQFSEKALKARVKELEGQLAKAQQQQQQQKESPSQAAPAAAPAAPASGPSVDLGMVAMMEGQLGRLSEIIRTREAELGQMRSALQAGLLERKELTAQVEALQAALEQAQLGGGGAGLGGGSGNGSVSGSASALGSPKSVSGAAPRGAPHVSPNRPYRAGLTSKPKFK